jgi:hypothetical protein
MAVWNIGRPCDKTYVHLVHFVVNCYIFSRFGILYQEKSGNPGARLFKLIVPNAAEAAFPLQQTLKKLFKEFT